MKNYVFIEKYDVEKVVTNAYPQGGDAKIATVKLRYVKAKTLRAAHKTRENNGGTTATAIHRGMFDNSLWPAGAHVIDLTA
jgi:Holliday junction resolvase